MIRDKRCCDCHYCVNREIFSCAHACRKLALSLSQEEYLERHGCVCFKPPEPKHEEPLPPTDGRDYKYLFNKEQDNGTSPRL